MKDLAFILLNQTLLKTYENSPFEWDTAPEIRGCEASGAVKTGIWDVKPETGRRNPGLSWAIAREPDQKPETRNLRPQIDKQAERVQSGM